MLHIPNNLQALATICQITSLMEATLNIRRWFEKFDFNIRKLVQCPFTFAILILVVAWGEIVRYDSNHRSGTIARTR